MNLITTKPIETPRENLVRLRAYQKRRNNWYDSRITNGENPTKVKDERGKWLINFEAYLDKLRREEYIV